MADTIKDVTAPLKNGASLPDHPNSTNSLKIVKFREVFDAEDGKELRSGILHNNELHMLKSGHINPLGHLYAYRIAAEKIYHTRNEVVIAVDCVEI